MCAEHEPGLEQLCTHGHAPKPPLWEELVFWGLVCGTAAYALGSAVASVS